MESCIVNCDWMTFEMLGRGLTRASLASQMTEKADFELIVVLDALVRPRSVVV